MRILALNKNWRFVTKEDKIYLINLVTSKQLEISENIEATLFLLENLRKGLKKSELVFQMEHKFPKLNPKWVIDSLRVLKAYGILQNPSVRPYSLSEKYLLGLDRQLDFLEEMFPREGKYKKQIQLKESKVAVLGLGTIAQYIILPLVASGIGKFKCIDFDVVEGRNIGRQPILRKNDIGKSKAEVIRGFLLESRFGIKVKAEKRMIQSSKGVEAFVRDCDIVLHCCDYPRFLIHRWINEACLKLKKPNLLVYSGRVGPFSIPFKTSCYGCLETFLKKHVVAYKELTSLIREEGLGRYPELAVVGALTGALAAKEIIAYILGIAPETFNTFFDINPFTLQITKHPLQRQKLCYACNKKDT
jgi:molybdopterin/thiamine biosynthesis adenylyltransferase